MSVQNVGNINATVCRRCPPDSLMGTSGDKPPPPLGKRPLLVYGNEENMKDQTIVSFSDQVMSRFLQIRELRGKQFRVSSPSGWCLFSDCLYGGKFLLWNSLILAKIRLPYLLIQEENLVPVLFGGPEDPDFKVLLFSTRAPVIYMCHIGARNWREIVYTTEYSRCFGDEDIQNESISLVHPFGYNGKLYFLSIRPKRKSFIMEGFDSGRISIQLLDIDEPVMPPYATSHYMELVVESDGFINSVYVHFGVNEEVISVQVHRLDLVEMRWVKVGSVPHLAFFIASNSAICCQASELGIKGNSVYILSNHDVERVREYDIGDMTLSVLRPVVDEDMTDSSPFWIMCDHRLINRSEEIENGHIVSKEVQVDAQGKESKRNKLPGEEVVRKRVKCDLKPDVAQSLGNYLSPVDYLQFRATCRTCRLVAPLDKFKESLLSNWKNGGLSLPMLMFIETDDVGAFIDPIRGDKYLMTLPPELSGCAIAHSKDGYLLMYGCPNRVFVFNPFARKLLSFTQTQEWEFETFCAGLSSNPTSNYSIVTSFKVIDHVYLTFACSSGQQLQYYMFADNSGFFTCDNSPVFYNGAFHFLGEDGHLGVLQPVQDSFSWHVHQPSKMLSSYKQKFLLECEGKLLSVFVSFLHKQVHVYRWNQSKSTWVKVHNLGNYMIYVSNSSSFSMIARDHGMENKVYFPSLCGQNIVFYSLDTKSFHTFENKDLEIDVYDTRERLQSCWIQPIWA